MGFVFFAHNGIDHSNHVEAAAHGSNTFVWVIMALAVAAVASYAARRLMDRKQTEEIEEEEG